MRPNRTIQVVALALVLATASCAEILGVEDVAGDDGGGGGGGDGAGGVGVGLPFTTSGGGATTAASSGTGGDAPSTGSGSGCGTPLPACPGAVPVAFEQEADLDLAFERDGRDDEIKVGGGRLELEPRDEGGGGPRYAAIRSKAVIAPGSEPCAVWIELLESGKDLAAGLAIGPGAPSLDAYRIERRGALVAARVDGVDVGQVPYAKDVTRFLRIRFDGAGSVGFDVSTDATCWTAVAPSQPMTADAGRARVHAEGAGKAKLDGYCL